MPMHRSSGLRTKPVRVGPAPARESYLVIHAILDAARRTGADAVHPGYGFLSENARFSEAVAEAGLVFIGPPADVIARLGSKVEGEADRRARGRADGAGLSRRRSSGARVARGRDRLSDPGQGVGGRRWQGHARRSMPGRSGRSNRARARRGDERVRRRHAVVRPLRRASRATSRSRSSATPRQRRAPVGARCSIQRRHQKVIEEAPVGRAQRREAAMGDAAVALGKAVGYVGAGTVEFIPDPSAASTSSRSTRGCRSSIRSPSR